MSGRGKSRFFYHDPNPRVTIGLTLSTSNPTLNMAAGPGKPFSILVTARILETPNPASPITLATHLNPLSSLFNRSFGNINRISTSKTSPDSSRAESSPKCINIFPSNWPHYIFEPNDLGTVWDFVTIPAPDSGEPYLIVSHELPWEKIKDANLVVGEKYRVKLTDKGLGTGWWDFGDLEKEFKGANFRQWKDGKEQDDGGVEGERKGEVGEKPELLKMVIEGDGVEFEVA